MGSTQEHVHPDEGQRTEVSGVRSTAAINGHPIHPMLIPLPIGALVLALASDVAFLITDDAFWAQASWWLLWAGLVTGVVAALVGLVELMTIHRVRSHRAGQLHVAMNTTALVATAANIAVRWGDHATAVLPWGLVLTAATALLLAGGGWFGGELTYRHGIGVTGH